VIARDDGVYSIELTGLLPLFLLITLFAFQLASIGGAMSMAESAARSGSRAAALGGDPRTAALEAVDPGLRDATTVGGNACATPPTGQTVTVCIAVPLVIPLIDIDVAVVERSATLPARGLGRG
jgi:CO/xanthine dehydrogenase FAD-binding subunit